MNIMMLVHAMGIKLPRFVFTDAKSIFDTITASKRLRELRRMTDISEIRRACKENEIDNVAWIRSGQNIADDLTRLVGNGIFPIPRAQVYYNSRSNNGSVKMI